MGWTIRHEGTDFEVVTDEGTRTARLLVDDVAVDGRTAGYWESSTLTHDGITVTVRWGPRNTVTACTLAATRGADSTYVPLRPPPGSKAARQEAFQRDHPTAYVVRRAAWASVEVLVGLLGVGALLGTVLTRVPILSFPDWLPDVSAPEWLRFLDLAYWLRRLGISLPDVGVPTWAEAVLDHKAYWLPIMIAVVVALGELERRGKLDAERDDQRVDDS